MLSDDPLWYKDAVIYEVHVRALCDAVGDGYGDFRGLTQKLDYLQDLGITAIWLLPFYPSPLRDDGYDISDYTNIHPQYGNLDDFRDFLIQAHDRGLRVITELVINHTSDQHPWFQRARRAAPGSPERDFYVWSETANKYRDARVIFKDFETSNWTYDHVAHAYFWHRFYAHQPDLNFDNPAVWEALLPVVDFWFQMGVDGMRLDAVPYLFEREGTNCENLADTHLFLKTLRKHVDEKYPCRMLLAEANQWPEDAAAYFGNGDECHMSFHFPVMPRLFMAMHMEDRFPIVDILDQTPAIPPACQWALFLRNHDELTLEMVTDEERDYMYRVYAHDVRARVNLGIRRRLAPLLGNNRRRIELMNGLLFSLPGTPVIYYGDEIGMGDNIYLGDRNGVRTPMQWSADRNAGFSRANPQKLYLPIIIDPEYHYEAIAGSEGGELIAWRNSLFRELRGPEVELLHPALNPTQQAHRSIRYGNRFMLKAYRRIEEGPHPELEIGKLFTENHRSLCVAPLTGSIDYRRRGHEPMSLAVIHGYIPNEGDAWQYTLDQLSVFFEHVATMPPLEIEPLPPLHRSLGDEPTPPPEPVAELLRGSLELVRLMGKRLGELHLALSSAVERSEFAPEPISLQYQRSVYQSLRNVLFDAVDYLDRDKHRIPADLAEKASQVRQLQPSLLIEFRAFADRRIHATRIRCHGDCKLDDVLSTGKDFVFIDFEGRPSQSIGERRIKRSPLRDVVGLMRSFDYAVYATLFGLVSGRGKAAGVIRNEDRPSLLPWAKAWRLAVHDAVLTGYFAVTSTASFIPGDLAERKILFRIMLLEKLLFELAGELRNRPAWLGIPIHGLLEAFVHQQATS